MKDLNFTILLSIIGFAGAIFNFFYSRHLFRSKEYPLVLDRTAEGEFNADHLHLVVSNKTEKNAVDVLIELNIFIGDFHFKDVTSFGTIPGLDHKAANASITMKYALARALPQYFTFERHNSALSKSIELSTIDHTPVTIFVESSVKFRPPLFSRRQITKSRNYTLTYDLIGFMGGGPKRIIGKWKIAGPKRKPCVRRQKEEITQAKIQSFGQEVVS